METREKTIFRRSGYFVRVINGMVILLFIISVLTGCKGQSVKEERDNFGRVVRRVIYKNKRIECQEEIKYLNNTDKPLIKVYKKITEGEPVPWWMEVYSYDGDKISQIKFFINIESKRTLSGKIDYQYENEKLKMIEYYSLIGDENQALNRHGFDLYYYSSDNLVNRRIIEYEYNPQTGDSMQISQYVVEYRDNTIQSMETKMLDRDSREMITKNETNIDIINEMINNIEKSLRDRCIGKSLNR